MKKSDAVDYFGSQRKLAAALGISQPAVSQWGEQVPERFAYRLQLMTENALVYDPYDYAPLGDEVPPAVVCPRMPGKASGLKALSDKRAASGEVQGQADDESR